MGSRGELAGLYRKRAAGRRLQVTLPANYSSGIPAGRRLASGASPRHRLPGPARHKPQPGAPPETGRILAERLQT